MIFSYNDMVSGRKVVTTAGTRQQITATDTPCSLVTIQAETDNTGNIAVGNITVVAATGSAVGAVLTPGSSVDVYINNLDKIYLDSTVNGDGVTYIYYKG